MIAEIKSDQSSLAAVRTVSSMQDELRYIVGKYDGSKYGWNINLTLYTDGIMLYNHSFILGYASLAEKAVPDVKSASDASNYQELNSSKHNISDASKEDETN